MSSPLPQLHSLTPSPRRRRWLHTSQRVRADHAGRVEPLARFEQQWADMIIGTVRILPTPGRHDAVIEVLRSVQGPVRAQPGCVACDVFDEQGPEPAVVLLERWETTEAFEHHLRSEAYRRVIAAVELSGAQPDDPLRTRRVGRGPGTGRAPAQSGRDHHRRLNAARERMRRMKVIIVGGVAGGASCAARLRRLDEKADILMVERGPYVSYANCGLPYHVERRHRGGVEPPRRDGADVPGRVQRRRADPAAKRLPSRRRTRPSICATSRPAT